MVARRLLARRQHRLLMVYLPGLDLVRSALPGNARLEMEPPVERTLRHVDSLVSMIEEDLDPEDTLLVIGEPGRSQGGGPDGVILALGRRVVAGRLGKKAGALDVAPTLLAMLGLPMAKDLPGAPERGFLAPGDVAWRLPVEIPTYGSLETTVSEDQGTEFDEELLDRLRSLGYIQ